jgi:hypothetical protein
MHQYQIFGRRLHSEVELAELRPRRSAVADWTLRIGRGRPVAPSRLSAEHEAGGEVLRVWETPSATRLEYDRAGCFDIAPGGREITWFPAPDPRPEIVSAVVLGPVLALALHAQGTVSLHASAVRIGSEGVVFLAPKHYGKSTLAACLLTMGARLITDDTLAVETEPRSVLLPGPHAVKLWRDSAEYVRPLLAVEIGSGVKPTLRRLPSHLRAERPSRCAAAYVLVPVGADASVGIDRFALPQADAALALVAHAKLGPLLEPAAAALVLTEAAAIARRVPVYRLTVPRDWQRLPELAEQLCDWHAAPAPARHV